MVLDTHRTLVKYAVATSFFLRFAKSRDRDIRRTIWGFAEQMVVEIQEGREAFWIMIITKVGCGRWTGFEEESIRCQGDGLFLSG